MIATPSVCKLLQKCKTSVENCLPKPSVASAFEWWAGFTAMSEPLKRHKWSAALVSGNNDCEHHSQVHGVEGPRPQTNCGLELWSMAASGHMPVLSLFMSTFLPLLKSMFSETGVKTHRIPWGMDSRSRVVGDIFIYCFNHAYCNQPTTPSKGHMSVKNGFIMEIASDFVCVCVCVCVCVTVTVSSQLGPANSFEIITACSARIFRSI